MFLRCLLGRFPQKHEQIMKSIINKLSRIYKKIESPYFKKPKEAEKFKLGFLNNVDWTSTVLLMNVIEELKDDEINKIRN